ncbi:MAG: RluA family pseudouridine synthase [Candidatus Omnitrophica bacterium]|nr:RluA family pseudouridine synthase [Candidatus Omnitrophota bacterium]
MDTHTLIVGEDHVNERVDIFLASNLPQCPSRSFAKHLIDQNLVSVNQKIVKPHYKIQIGDAIEVKSELPGELRATPQDIALDIFYEDEDIVVVNKPVGMVVHPAPGCRSGTLVNALLYRYQELSTAGDALRPGIVHRLDKETSGLIVVARNNKSHVRLAGQFEKRIVKKQYVALVENLIEFDEGKIDVPLGQHPQHREKRAILAANAKSAETVYRVLKRFKKSTLVALMPKTGRTHQLRVHMAYLGHPILGDDKYGKKANFPRLALHARSIVFKHPTKFKWIGFSSIIPKEFLKEDF